MFNAFTYRVRKLKQCTNLILCDENYTSFVLLLLKTSTKWGDKRADKKGTYSKRTLIQGERLFGDLQYLQNVLLSDVSCSHALFKAHYCLYTCTSA